jgi:L-ascorbate metabolism protein UlaG (beta-lactamase superfamily)
MYKILFIIILGLFISACTHQNPYYNPTLSHHTPTGFQNPHVEQTPTTGELLGWATRIGRPLRYTFRKRFKPPQLNVDRALVANPPADKIQVTWIGHSTFLIQHQKFTILTDPVFSKRVSPISFLGPKRYAPPALTIEELPPIDAVIISHSHYDHMDTASLKALGNKPHYFVPLGIKPWLISKGIAPEKISEMDWWEHKNFKNRRFILTPARHFSNRHFLDLNRTLWGGWMIESAGKKIYFAGDTGYTPAFREIGRRFAPVDLSFIPIGAYDPYMATRTVHIVPRQSVQIHRDIQSKQSIGMHWGTFKLTGEPMKEPPELLQKELSRRNSNHFNVMKIGETRLY